MRWGLIGASDIAETRVISAMREAGDEVTGVFSSSLQRGREFASRSQLERSTNSLDELLSWDIDAVYISTTNELHAPQAIAAAEAKKHILCEKPLAVSVPDAKAMIEAAAKNSVVLATNHHLRNSPANHAIRRIIESGELGRIYSVQVNHAVSLPDRLRGWRLTNPEKGGGVVLDITVHNLDLIRFLLDDEVESATALTSNLGFGNASVEDESICLFRTKNGVLVSTHESFNIPYSAPSLEIFGAKGTVFATNVLSQDPVGEVTLKTSAGSQIIDLGPQMNLYVTLLSKFKQAVLTGSKPASSGFDGLMSMAGALAALKSANSGRLVTLQEVLS